MERLNLIDTDKCRDSPKIQISKSFRKKKKKKSFYRAAGGQDIFFSSFFFSPSPRTGKIVSIGWTGEEIKTAGFNIHQFENIKIGETMEVISGRV